MTMRSVLALLVTLAACGGAGRSAGDVPDDLAGGDAGNGSGGTSAPACFVDTDCVLSASSCCSCPEFAARADDPTALGCDGVSCPAGPPCANNVKAACDPVDGCVVRCVEIECEHGYAGGFAMDPATGCLACAAPTTPTLSGCSSDSDCIETRQDCCGCAEGGVDTAVLSRNRASYDAALHCDADPSCPGVNACESGASARCVQSSCVLTSAHLPPNACGRPDLMDCPAGQTCILNRNPMATELGVGVCGTP
ncbi:MAG TPA: hypothetical protein VGM90_20895 [Kofleriaceae bacterium]|jgi:hypothetical protein